MIGVDPAAPMLDIARQRSAASDAIHWIHGHTGDVPAESADLAVMMGHVAQNFIDDEEWSDTLRQIHRIVASGGWLTFETRKPSINWARQWTREHTTATYPHPDGGEFTSWVEVVNVTGSPQSYSMTHEGHTLLPDGRHLVVSETLRFRDEGEILGSLDEAGFDIETTWGDWDRSAHSPAGPELIVLAKRR